MHPRIISLVDLHNATFFQVEVVDNHYCVRKASGEPLDNPLGSATMDHLSILDINAPKTILGILCHLAKYYTVLRLASPLQKEPLMSIEMIQTDYTQDTMPDAKILDGISSPCQNEADDDTPGLQTTEETCIRLRVKNESLRLLNIVVLNLTCG